MRFESVPNASDRKVPEGFLKRKFQAPSALMPYIEETSITERVGDVSSWRACLLSAPAGYGKTALLAQWFRMFQERDSTVPIWVTLDVHDARADRFLQALAYCFAYVDARFACLAEKEALESGIEALAVEFVNLADEACRADTDYVVFLDAYDTASSVDLDEVLIFLNRNMGSNLRFVAAGRYFSSRIDDLLLDSPVIEFGTTDLLFDDDRLLALASALLPGLGEAEYWALVQEGSRWPLLIVFTALARKRARTPQDLRRRVQGYCRRFFEREVMANLDATTCEFVIETSLLEDLDPELCDCVTGRNDAVAILEQLEAKNLFVSYRAEGRVWRYAPLFRDYLQSKLLCLHRSQIEKLAGRAGEWFAERGKTCEHARCLAITCDPYYTEGTIASSVGLVLDDEQESLVEHLLARPAAEFETDPYLAWVAAWDCLSAGLVGESRDWVAIARNLGESEETEMASRFIGALCLALEGDSAGSLAVIRELLGEGSASVPRQFQCLLMHMEGENSERLGLLKQARDLYLKAYSLAERADSSFYKLFDLYLLAQHYLSLGDFEGAEATACKALASVRQSAPLHGAFLAVRASIRVERHDLEEAAELMERALQSVSRSANVDMYVDVCLVRARMERVRGNGIEALGVMADLVDFIEGKCVPRNMGMRAHALRAALAVEFGEMSAARSSERAIEGFLEDPDLFRSLPCVFAKARVLWGLDRRRECLALLDANQKRVTGSGSTYLLVQFLILRCSYRAEEGDETRAMVDLSQALDLAMRNDYMSVFIEGKTCVRELLLKLVVGRKMSFAVRAYAKEVLLLFGSEVELDESIALNSGSVQGYYALTEREREILHKLNSGMSRGEIAVSFGISQNTVKSHLKNIYSKLGVRTRSEAYKASECECGGMGGIG